MYATMVINITSGEPYDLYIGRLERGHWKGGTRIDNIRKLAEALGVDPAELVGDA